MRQWKYQYSKKETGRQDFSNDIAAVGKLCNLRKGIQNCRHMEIEKKIYGLKKTKYMDIDMGREPEEATEEIVKEGIVQETDIYKYLYGHPYT